MRICQSNKAYPPLVVLELLMGYCFSSLMATSLDTLQLRFDVLVDRQMLSNRLTRLGSRGSCPSLLAESSRSPWVTWILTELIAK
jgi:hypothetical protein